MPEVTDVVDVQAIDFCEFLQSLRDESPESKISIKMDIEGAEFVLLRNMISRNAFANVNNLWVETHERFVDGESSESVASLLKEISDLGVNIYGDWD